MRVEPSRGKFWEKEKEMKRTPYDRFAAGPCPIACCLAMPSLWAYHYGCASLYFSIFCRAPVVHSAKFELSMSGVTGTGKQQDRQGVNEALGNSCCERRKK